LPNFTQSFNLFTTVFLSIILEAIPFLLLGTFLSSIIEVFISEKFFEKYIPRNRFAALLMATVIGLIFPVCECAVIPIAARLIKKGVPVYFAVSFILAVPIINIPVMLSTYYAFSGQTLPFLLRVGCGFFIAYVIGLVISVGKKERAWLRPTAGELHCHHCRDAGENAAAHEDENDDGVAESPAGRIPEAQPERHYAAPSRPGVVLVSDPPETAATSAPAPTRPKARAKLARVLDHSVDEFFDNGKYLVMGAAIASLFQTFVPRGALAGLTQSPVLSSAAMGAIAYVMSICSQTDAFVARSFMGQFPAGAVVGFMVIGAMMDIKNTAMLGKVFKKRFIAILFAMIFGLGVIASTIINLLSGGVT
jgi:uncharacterized membrane protein YraQ (UPF0718 family)